MASFLTWVCGPHARITPVNFCPTNSGFPLLKSRQSGGTGPVATPGFHIGPYGPVSSLYRVVCSARTSAVARAPDTGRAGRAGRRAGDGWDFFDCSSDGFLIDIW